MKQYIVKRYEDKDKAIWDLFVTNSKNATFLFQRDFMEYHKDRFDDYSLLVFERDTLVALLPANCVSSTVFSHQGLTYGGLVLQETSKLYEVIFVFRAILKYLNDNKITDLYIKQMPSIYCNDFSDEVDYLLYVCKAELVMKHNISVINLKNKFTFSKSRRECINRGKKLNLIIKEETDFKSFWNELLIPNLQNKYNSKPVHSEAEISLLREKFPENIKHFNVYHDEQLVCGTTLFITKNVVKPQYISGSENNNVLGSIDFLYDYLINDVAKDKCFFDFGPSHENNGLQIVKNINFWKESFGAHSLVQDFYNVKTNKYSLLESILI